MRRRSVDRFLFAALLTCTSLASGRAKAIGQLYLDFDDTFLETRASLHGVFGGNFRLFRNDIRNSVLLPAPAGPEFIDVSPRDLHRMTEHLAQGQGAPGSLNMKMRLEDGRSVRPGEYFLRNPDSYLFFGPAPEGRNYILEAFKIAEERADRGEGTFRGPAWDLAAHWLGDPVLAKQVSFITARRHPQRDWDEFFAYLIARRYVGNKPARVLNMSLPEFDRYSRSTDIAERKTGFIAEKIEKLKRQRLDGDARLAADGRGGEAEAHSVIFAENDQRTMALAFRVFQRLALGGQFPVKLSLFNYGTESEVRASGLPRFSILRPDGVARRAKEAELRGEPEVARGKVGGASGLACSAFLTAGGAL